MNAHLQSTFADAPLPAAGLRAATQRLCSVAAKCKRLGAISPEETRDLKHRLKQARWARVKGADAIGDLVHGYERYAAELEARVADLGTERPAVRSPEATESPTVVRDWPSATTPGVLCDEKHPSRGIDELNEREQEVFSRKCQLVRDVVERGISVSDAVARSGLGCSERSARNYVRAYRLEGIRALIDGRHASTPRNRRIMTDEIQKLVLDTWLQKRAAFPMLVSRLVSAECQRRGLRAPSYAAVYQFLRNQPESLRMIRSGNYEAYNKRFKPVMRFEQAEKGNDLFQCDHSVLKIWGKEQIDGKWQPMSTYITVALDAYSRSIAGIVISSKYPDAQTIRHLLLHAFREKENADWPNRGYPRVLQIDRGKDFMSNEIRMSCDALHVFIDPDPPYYPNMKGKVERFFQTLDRGCIRALPGHKDDVGTSMGAARKRVSEFLTLEQLRTAIEAWIVGTYHRTLHREIGATPVDAWRRSVGFPRMPESDDTLHVLMLKVERRMVMNDGIHFEGRRYFSKALVNRIGAYVDFRHDPENREAILVYCPTTGQPLGEATMRFAADDIKAARREQRQGVIATLRASHASIARFGRSVPKAPRRIEPPVVAPPPAPKKRQSHDVGVEELIRRYDDHLRGRG